MNNTGFENAKNFKKNSPFGRSITVCCGPTRSGKSYLKKIIDSHFMGYHKNFSAIDIGPDFETLTNKFEDKGK